jgi:hypothetical protein
LQRTSLLLSLIVICLVAPLRAQTSVPKPDPELKKLHVLIGHWTYEGEYKPGPLRGGSKVKGVWDARMILGGFFLHEEFSAGFSDISASAATTGLEPRDLCRESAAE